MTAVRRQLPIADGGHRGRGRAPTAENGLTFLSLDQQLARIEAHLRAVEARSATVLGAVRPEWTESARNLVHYAALRQLDLRELQLLLQQHGLSSLGRSESFVMASLLEVRPVVKLRAEKGINLPDSELPVSALTDEDRAHLAFVAEHADLVGLSFVRSPADVAVLHDALDALGRRDIGIVLKIETKAGFESLPRILLQAMRRPPIAVMIARGDLAVELGFERLAEVQEEILWLCEASHIPVIWATQVLDTLARTGIPSRAEVTDAAASVAAECVMPNKGPHVEEALRTLVDILRRMERHHYKKRSIFRKLRVSALDETPPPPPS